MKSSVANPTGGAPEDYAVAIPGGGRCASNCDGNGGIRPRKGARNPSDWSRDVGSNAAQQTAGSPLSELTPAGRESNGNRTTCDETASLP